MKKIAFIFVGIFVMAFAGDAKADIINHMFRIQCMPEFGYLEISEIGINETVVEKQLKENPEEIYKKYGIREYFHLIKKTEDFRVIGEYTFKDTCTIDNHKYEISVKPYTCNANLQGRMGGWISINVSVDLDGKKLIDDLTFDACERLHPEGAKLNNFSRIKINHHEGYFYAGKGTGYWIDEVLKDGPINNDIKIIKD